MRAFRCAALALCGVLGAQQALATCYVVYGPDDQVLYRSTEPPVDLSLPLHQTLPKVAPGGKLVFSLDNHGCDAEVNRLTPKMALPAPTQPPIPKASPDPQG
ncbi:MAG TPA: hypothetical protein PKN26_06080 [Giesbergeria sp.]|jgi:hypothetical protein|uniref:hypothetical protein n=1 Tax=Acidovorax sp. 210-6 TaxID=2699468 RepID=UPI00138A6018|nr:hypothetical protein [Acidovorax sp. 210-6]MCL4769843.1 hypothetical protein [Burkholderiaceae bacterium]HMZ85125.1 hypothetical protein [Giesbergeria sp.]NCU65237.1 hypothetical protein [Acidovorax sp. 210-6]HNE70583.1 hypothetical protein [Giesbergeria sp.]HNI76642.1 hypothetical protein [Giesbergeria sp.]